MLKEKLEMIWNKVVEHKELAIRIGIGLAGAVIGATVTAVVINAQQNSFPYDLDAELAEEEAV